MMKIQLVLLATLLTLAASARFAPAQTPTLVYSFETLFDSTDNPNPAGTRPDDFHANGGGTTISQATIGATDASHSMLFSMVQGATFSGAQTAYLPPINDILNQPTTEEVTFDLTIPAGQQFAGNFARIGVSEFGLDTKDPDPNNQFVAQVQTDLQAETNIALAPGTYHLSIPLLAMNNPVTFQADVPFWTCFGSDPNSQLTATSWEFYLNKSNDAPITVYIDNVKAQPLLGDTNDDFSVDSTDLATLSANLGKTITGGFSQGDFNGDGQVNADDVALYQLGLTQFHYLTFAPLPEPAGAGVIGAGVIVLMSRRKK